MRRHFGDAHAFVTDVTSGYAQINVQGPRSRELLQSLTSADLSNEAFPFRTARVDRHRLRPGAVRPHHLPRRAGLRALRPGRAGGARLRPLVAAGEAVGLRHAGLKALASLRMEKGYRDYGHDIDNTDSVLEAGLGFAVDLDKPGGFIGRDAVARAEGRRPADPPARAGAGRRSRAADVPRRGGAPRRSRRRVRARRLLRLHARGRGRPGDGRGRRAGHRGLPVDRARGTSRSPAAATRLGFRCARSTTPTTCGSSRRHCGVRGGGKSSGQKTCGCRYNDFEPTR